MPDQLEIRECSFGENKDFRFQVADTGLQLMKGLAGAENIGETDGMIFDFGCDWSPIMTPKGLLFPVDLAFITEAGSVVEMHTLDPEIPFPRDTRRTDIRYALEVEKGFFERHGITLGEHITFVSK